jgi:hypothetical protein
MIGSIWTTTNVPYGTETVPADQMYPSLYAWSVDHYVLTQDIEPGVGYWALAYSDCELCVFPAPPPPPPSSTLQALPRALNDWSVKLDVTCGVGTDNAEFGLNEAATDEFDPQFDVPLPPPPPPPYQQAYFYYPGNPVGVKRLSTSYIPPHAEGNSWPFQLGYNGDASDVTITWNAADIAAVPADCSLLFVVDSVEIDMRTTPTYTFSATTVTYEFEIRAINGDEKPDLVITEKWLCWPDNCMICYNVTNIGDGTAPACHNTALYVDDVEVAHDHVPVDLAPGESHTGCFNGYEWGYTPPSDNITVCADNNESIDELGEDNNCLPDIWMCGDVNCDGRVTMSDVRKVFNRYLDPIYPLDLPWAADVNCDGRVTMSDVRKVFNRYLDLGYELECCCEDWLPCP